MKALDYALAVEELEQSGLSADALAVALASLNEISLADGRKQLQAVRFIEEAIGEGRSLSYAIDTGAMLFEYSDRWLDTLWRRYLAKRGPTLVTTNDFSPEPIITEVS